MRIGGLASGIDTDSIINDMMRAKRIPLDKMLQKKTYTEWQVADYRKVRDELRDFHTSAFNKLVISNNFSHKTVTSSSPSDVSVKNLNSTKDFSGTIEVHQLAKNATLQSGAITIPEKFADKPGHTTLEDLGMPDDEIYSLTIQAPGMEKAKTIPFGNITSLEEVAIVIRNETGVEVFFDEHTKKFSMSAKNGGQGDFEISGKLATLLKMDSSSPDVTKSAGQNAEFTLNGLRTQRASNTFTVNGHEITLKNVTSHEVTYSSSPDTEKIYENVVSFVDQYNELIDKLNSKIREKKFRDFPPLTAEQKKDMSDKEIELWEEKAKSGTLRNDPDISSMLSQMRVAMLTEVDGMTLKDIGIKPKADYLSFGKLEIDEGKLKEAITKDPSKIHNLFSKEASGDKKAGIAIQLRNVVDATRKKIELRAGGIGAVDGDSFTLGKQIKFLNKQINRFEDRLKVQEQRLWRQFTAMEQAMQRANAQMANLMNALGGGGAPM